jgi:hypothetical protein
MVSGTHLSWHNREGLIWDKYPEDNIGNLHGSSFVIVETGKLGFLPEITVLNRTVVDERLMREYLPLISVL